MKISKSTFIKIGYIIAVIALMALIILPIIFTNKDNSLVLSDRNWFGPIYYGICLVSSLICLSIFIFFHKKINLWAVLAFISASIAMTGYLGLSLSDDISKALLANRIGYFGNVFLLPFIFMTIANICKVKVKKGCIGLMFLLAFIMFIFSSSQGYFDLFYKNPSYEMVNGFASIKKEYGFMHSVYIVYIGLMLVLILGLFIYALKKRKTPSTLYTVLIFLAAFVNVFLWVIERFLPKSVEFLAGSYLVTEVILLVVYRHLEKIGAFDYCNITLTIKNDDEPNQQMSITVDEIPLNTVSTGDENEKYLLINEDELKLKLETIFEEFNLTGREIDVVCLMIKGLSRKQIAEKLFIGEETVKTHIKHIFQKLSISSSKELKQKTSKSLGKLQ